MMLCVWPARDRNPALVQGLLTHCDLLVAYSRLCPSATWHRAEYCCLTCAHVLFQCNRLKDTWITLVSQIYFCLEMKMASDGASHHGMSHIQSVRQAATTCSSGTEFGNITVAATSSRKRGWQRFLCRVLGSTWSTCDAIPFDTLSQYQWIFPHAF